MRYSLFESVMSCNRLSVSNWLQQTDHLSLSPFNGHFPGEPGLAGVY